jgi:DNA-binding CsgD family transcriptional regulator
LIRNENEKLLQSKVEENYSQILLEMVEILTQENQEEKIRQYSATFIKYLFKNRIYLMKWENSDQNFRDLIKQKILSCLASNSQLIRKATSIAIASICSFEIPRKNWNNIIDILNSTALNKDNINYRLTSLIAIGHIIDELKITDLTVQQKNLLRYLTRGLSNKEIAEKMFIEPSTVKTHLDFIMNKTGIHSRTELAVKAANLGLSLNTSS